MMTGPTLQGIGQMHFLYHLKSLTLIKFWGSTTKGLRKQIPEKERSRFSWERPTVLMQEEELFTHLQ